MFNKTGAVKALKQAYKKGYQLIPGSALLTIGTQKWVARVYIQDIPKEVSLLLVEQAGYLPTRCEFIKEHALNQLMLSDETERAQQELNGYIMDAKSMCRLPVTLRDRWQLYRDADGACWAFDKDLLAIMEERPLMETAVTSWGAGVWMHGNEALVVLPALLGDKDHETVQKIADLFKDAEPMEPDEEPKTMCLWEEDEA